MFCQPDTEGTCPEDYRCVEHTNPNFGLTNYDNMFYAVLTTFEIITLEGWTDTMYIVRRSEGSYLYDMFFVFCVIFGAFFVLNLMIAVQFNFLNVAFDEIDKKKAADKERAIKEKEDFARKPTEEATASNMGSESESQIDEEELAKRRGCCSRFNPPGTTCCCCYAPKQRACFQ